MAVRSFYTRHWVICNKTMCDENIKPEKIKQDVCRRSSVVASKHGLFRLFRNNAKNNSYVRHMYVSPFARPHGTTRLPLDGYS